MRINKTVNLWGKCGYSVKFCNKNCSLA